MDVKCLCLELPIHVFQCKCSDDRTPHDLVFDGEICCYDECETHEFVQYPYRAEIEELLAACLGCTPRKHARCPRHDHMTWCVAVEEVVH